MEKEIRELLSVLTTGDREQVRNAKKQFEKLWHLDIQSFQAAAPIIIEYLPKFDQIKSHENQAAFVSGLNLFFLILGDEYFNTLADFTLKVLQHPNGSVREAIRKTADWLYVSLSSRTYPFVYPKSKKLTEKQKEEQKEAVNQCINFVKRIELLIDQYNDETENVEYIHEMKPSVNKSLQLFWSRLTERPMYRKILESIRPLPYDIARKREEIEKELKRMLKESQSDFILEDIKDIIFSESSHDCLNDIIAMFDTGKGSLSIEDILENVNEAWNYFPHKVLNGLSPAEKVLEYQQMQQKQPSLPN